MRYQLIVLSDTSNKRSTICRTAVLYWDSRGLRHHCSHIMLYWDSRGLRHHCSHIMLYWDSRGLRHHCSHIMLYWDSRGLRHHCSHIMLALCIFLVVLPRLRALIYRAKATLAFPLPAPLNPLLRTCGLGLCFH